MRVEFTEEEKKMFDSFDILPRVLGMKSEECLPYHEIPEQVLGIANKAILNALNTMNAALARDQKLGNRLYGISKEQVKIFNSIKRKFQEKVYNLK